MPKVAPGQTQFTGGEFSPLLYGRVDAERYRTGLGVCLNYISTLQGPLVRRPGTRFVAEVKDSAVKTRLIAFEFSTTQAYILEFSDQVMRVYKDHGIVESAPSTPYELVTPYLEADLFELKFVQSADTLYVAHPSYAPRKITRTGHAAWTISTISFQDGPYLPQNTTATTMQPSATTGAINITASVATFAATDVGRVIRIKHGSTWGWATITGFTSTTVVAATVGGTFGAATAQTAWRLGLWGSALGYPGAVAFFEDRLVWGGSTSYPQRIDLSCSGDYENYAPTASDGTVAATNAIGYTLNSSDVQAIRWLLDDDKGLLVGTVKAEWVVRPSTQSEALSPTNIRATRSTTYGSANVQAVRSGTATMFVQRAGRKVREFSYVYEVDGFRGPDITTISEHITRSGVTQMALQQEPWNVLWACRDDGVLIGLTYDRDVDSLKAGWHRHELGGYSDAAQTEAAVVESVACIPRPDGTSDELWVCVRRYINGASVRYVEYMEAPFAEDDVQEDAYYVDCGLTYDGVPADVMSGLDHLEGQSTAILADGAAHPARTVSTAQVTLDADYSVVHIGLPYNSDARTLRFEAGSGDGAALTKTRRIHRVDFLLHRSIGLKVGPDFDNLVSWSFRRTTDPMGQPPSLFSGVKGDSFGGDHDTEGYICWRQDQPLPSTILAVVANQLTNDRG